MSKNLEEFQTLLSDGWKLEEIHYNFQRVSGWKIAVKFAKSSETHIIHAENDGPFLDHIIHYHFLPDPKTWQIELRYVEDTEKYFELEKKLFSFICGMEPYFPISTDKRLLSVQDHKNIEVAIKTWIESEDMIRLFPMKMPRLFYDVLVLRKRRGNIDCLILEKEKTALSDIHRILKESSDTDWTKCYTAVFLCPKVTPDFNRDALLMTILFDAKTRQVDAACVGTLRSILNCADRRYTKGRELVEATSQLTRKMLESGASNVYVVAPFRDSEYTPVPWIAYLLLAKPPCEFDRVEEKLAIYPHEALIFGDTGIASERSSLDFKRKPQSAAAIVELENTYLYIVRYDRSAGESKFHIDCEISIGDTKFKLLEHHPVLFRDIWNLNENLYIAFLSAGAFDVKFAELITADIEDFDKIMTDQPLAAYPLIYRGHIEPRETWLRQNLEAMKLVRKFWDDPSYSPSPDELTLTKSLEDKGLIEKGGLTCLAIMILSRTIGVE